MSEEENENFPTLTIDGVLIKRCRWQRKWPMVFTFGDDLHGHHINEIRWRWTCKGAKRLARRREAKWTLRQIGAPGDSWRRYARRV